MSQPGHLAAGVRTSQAPFGEGFLGFQGGSCAPHYLDAKSAGAVYSARGSTKALSSRFWSSLFVRHCGPIYRASSMTAALRHSNSNFITPPGGTDQGGKELQQRLIDVDLLKTI